MFVSSVQAQEVGECNMKIGLLEKKLETVDAEVHMFPVSFVPSLSPFSLSALGR